MTSEIGISSSPMPRKTRGCLTYMDADADRIWPQVRRRPSRRGATGVHVGRTTTNVIEADENRQQERNQCRAAEEQDEAARAPLDRATEEVGGAGSDEPARSGRRSFGRASPPTT